MLRSIANLLVRGTRPLVWRIANAYDLRINRAWSPQGRHALIHEDSIDSFRNNVPKSVYFNTRSGTISIGANTVFGEDVMVLTGKHYSIAEAESTGLPLHYVPENGRDIVIGRGCYIGSGAILIGKLVVGENAVIGAGSVVTRDVPPRAFVAGVPAKLVRIL